MNYRNGLAGTLVLLLTAIASAQDAPTERKRPLAAPAAIPAARQAQEKSIEAARGRENLTEEQRTQLRDASEDLREEQRALSEKLREARRELETTAQAEPLDEPAVRAKAKILGDLEGDAAILRAKYRQKIREVLPPGSAERLEQAPGQTPEFRSRLNSVVRKKAPAEPGATPGNRTPGARPGPPPQVVQPK